MSKLTVKYNGEDIDLDDFYKSLLFQRIMDDDFTRDERDILLVILRKTVHFDKWYDSLGIYHFSNLVGICQSKLRQTIAQLEAKGFIEVERSKGGKTDNGTSKYHTFSLSKDLIFLVADRWMEIKEEQGYEY